MADEKPFAYLVMEEEFTGDCVHYNEVGVYQDLPKAVDAVRNTSPTHVKITAHFVDGHSEPVQEDMYCRKPTRDEALKMLEEDDKRSSISKQPLDDVDVEMGIEIYSRYSNVFLTPEEIKKRANEAGTKEELLIRSARSPEGTGMPLGRKYQSSSEWLEANRSFLNRLYAGKTVIVVDQKVVKALPGVRRAVEISRRFEAKYAGYDWCFSYIGTNEDEWLL